MKLLPALMLLVALPAAGQATVERSRLVGLSASVVKIEARRAQGGYSLGSGVAVAPNKVVTNCHVTRDCGGRAGAARRCALGCRSPGQSARTRPVRAARASLARRSRGAGRQPGPCTPGDPVAALGYTGGAGLQVSDGDVIALHRHAGASVIQSSNWFTSGASGGGLFDQRLRLVGVLTFRLRGGATHYFAAPAEWLAPLLADGAPFRPLAPLGDAPAPYWQETASPATVVPAGRRAGTGHPMAGAAETQHRLVAGRPGRCRALVPAWACRWSAWTAWMSPAARWRPPSSAKPPGCPPGTAWAWCWCARAAWMTHGAPFHACKAGRPCWPMTFNTPLDRACAVASRPAQCPVEPA